MRAGQYLALALVGCAFHAPDLEGSAPDSGQIEPPDAMPADMASDDPPDAADLTPDAAPDPTVAVSLPRGDLAIVLDGDLAEWLAVPTRELGPTAHFDHYSNSYVESVSGTFATVYDGDAIWFAFAIDDVSVTPPDSTYIYDDDSVYLFVDPDDDGGAFDDPGDFRIGVRTDAMCSSYPTGLGVTCGVVVTGDRYTVELRIDRGGLAAPPSASELGLVIAVNDDDDLANPGLDPNDWVDGEAFWLEVPSTCTDCCAGEEHKDPWCDASIYGTLRLSP